MRLSEVIERAIALAQPIREASSEQGDEPSESLLKRLPQELELTTFLNSLPPATIYMLTAIMYLGRGDFGTVDLLGSYEEMSDTFDRPSDAVGQMVEKAPLSEYLNEGLSQLRRAGIDVDDLLESYSSKPLVSLPPGESIELVIGPWYCDTCGKLIETPEDGMVQWLTRTGGHRRVGRDLRIVHHRRKSPLGGPSGCYPDQHHELRADGSILADWHLDSVIGPDGLVRLLSRIEDGEIPVREVNRVIMRLFVPGYERARRYFEKAIAVGVVEPTLPNDYFFQKQLEGIILNIPRLEEEG